MSQFIDKILQEVIKLDIEIGDVILAGKWRNKKVVVKEIGEDEHGLPTINGKSILKIRIAKLEKKKDLKESSQDYTDYSNLDKADTWLAKYTYSGRGKNPPEDILNELIHRYTLDKPTTIYRGLNFRTKEEYEKFISQFEQGESDKFQTTGISSWAFTPEDAHQFAVTQPSYILDYETMRLYDEAAKEGEVVTGFCGVILSFFVKPIDGIDVTKSKHAKENEFILKPGVYNIKIYKILKKFRQQLEQGETTIEEVITKMATTPKGDSESELNKFYGFILKNFSNEIKSQDLKSKIFKITIGGTRKCLDEIHAEIFNFTRHTFASSYPFFKGEVHVNFNWALFFLYEKGLFNPQDESKVLQYGKAIIKKYDELTQQYPEYSIQFKSLDKIANICNMQDEVISIYRKHIKHRYDELNSRENIKRINAIKNPAEKHKAMEEIQNSLMYLLKQIA